MSLSIKELKDMSEKDDVAAFMDSQGKGSSALAEQLKEHLGSAALPADEEAEAGAAPDAAGGPAEEAAVPPETEPDKEA